MYDGLMSAMRRSRLRISCAFIRELIIKFIRYDMFGYICVLSI